MKSAPDEIARARTQGETPRCVWMSAGILSYQLCDRQLECDRCPLDAALRMHFKRPQQEDPPLEPELPGQRLYSRNHCWIALLEEERARIGVETGLADALGSPKAVVLPALAEKIRHNEVCAWIVIDGGTLPLRAPLSGSITCVNSQLCETPSALKESPFRDGWLFEVEIKPDEAIRAHFMAKKDAERIFAADIARFRGRLRREIDNAAGKSGATLYDGGEFIGDAASMLGGKRYVAILKEELKC